MRNNVQSFWADYRIEELKRMWAAGHSGSQIATMMGSTRCAVLGKVYRLNLGARIFVNTRTAEQIRAAKRAKNKRANERRRVQPISIKKMALANLEALRCVEVDPLGKTMLELGANECRYPSGDGPFTFCGHSQMGGSSYCGSHFGLSVRRGQP